MARTAKKIAPTVEYKTKAEVGITRERNTVIVDRELNRIIERNGHVTPEMIVEAASAKTSPLHSMFEWDDAEAARQHRIARAYDLMIRSGIQSVLSRPSEPPSIIGLGASSTTVRRLLPAKHGTGQFKFRKDVLDDVDARAELVERRITALRGWCNENVDIEELAPIREAILAVLPG